MKPVKIRLINLVNELDPPLGLASIATYTREKIGRDSLDISIVDNNFKSPLKEIKKDKPDIVGISAMTIYFNQARKLAGKIKELYPDILVIIGGVHISTHKDSFSSVFDIAVIGEGEETFCQIASLLLNGRENIRAQFLTKVNGIMFWQGGEKVETEPRQLIEPLDSIPIIDRSFFNKKYFAKTVNRLAGGRNISAATMMTARGCPFKCVFCSTSLFWRKTRFFSPQRIAEEAEYLHSNFGVEVISIWDDLFGISKQRVSEIIGEFKKRDLLGKISLGTMFKADLIDDQMCILLKELGVKGLNFGFESGSPKILSYLKKDKLTVEKIKNAVIICRRHGLKVFGSFMLASPGETIEDMSKTIELIDFMKGQDVEGVWLFVTTPFPGTELWRYGQEQGLLDNNFDFDCLSVYNDTRPIFLDESIALNEFQGIFRTAAKKAAVFSRDTWRNRIKRAVLDPKRFVKKIYNLIFLYNSFPLIIKNLKKKLIS